MFQLLKKCHNQKGQVAVLVIFIFIILCGFAGFVIDTWLIAYNKQQLQNALDLSALAAIQEAVNTDGQVQSTAIAFAKKNHIHADELTITHPYDGDNNKIELVAQRTVNLVFMPIFGKKTKTISTRAVAELLPGNTSSYIFDYALFSGDEARQFYINGSSVTINGDSHINGNTRISGADARFRGDFECVGPVVKDGASVSFDNLINPAEVLPMDIIDIQELKKKASVVYNSGKAFSNTTVNVEGIIFVDGDVDINDSSIKGKGSIVANGDIYINGADFTYDAEDDFIGLYANANIDINGSDVNVEGALYAPNGYIRFNGSSNRVYGAVMAKYLEELSGSDLTITYDGRAKGVMGSGGMTSRLIE